ncbi:MAG: antitoxin VbhA family protein [Sedimentibacter sp.]|uniref:antitoxin VbhA family protein n=1 Tax=Sedimentibacter sp. TaxID=1960295 RepID=UPI00298264CB|nr:antitoxin VbhA family protein [Sedimentibacter sp.]MDW5299210.1 antitoxin VbhA family protein [Sedimentibacter sp.]
MDINTNSKSAKAWKTALDMQKIDEYTPSEEFKSLIEKEIRGEISTEDIITELTNKYTQEV